MSGGGGEPRHSHNPDAGGDLPVPASAHRHQPALVPEQQDRNLTVNCETTSWPSRIQIRINLLDPDSEP